MNDIYFFLKWSQRWIWLLRCYLKWWDWISRDYPQWQTAICFTFPLTIKRVENKKEIRNLRFFSGISKLHGILELSKWHINRHINGPLFYNLLELYRFRYHHDVHSYIGHTVYVYINKSWSLHFILSKISASISV